MPIIKILLIGFFCFFAQSLLAKPLTVLLDWYPNADHAPLFVAQANGFFKAQELDVKLISPTDPGDPLKIVAAGKADIAISYQPALLMAVDQQIPLVRIGTLIDQPLNAIAVLSRSGITDLSQLKDKTIGYSVNGTDHIMLNTAIQHAGLQPNDVHLINVHYGLTQALMTGHVDAITGIMRNIEPFEMQNQGQATRLFLYEDYGVPSYDELIFVTNRDHVNDPRIPAFLSALSLATQALLNDPNQGWQAFITLNPALNNHLNHQSWFATLPYFPHDPAAFNAERYNTFATYLFKQHVIKAIPPLSSYTVMSSKDDK